MQEIFNAVDNSLSHEFYDRYLHDFVCSLPLDVEESKNFEESAKVRELIFGIFGIMVKIVKMVKMETVLCS